jgi:hypothetical protein
MGVFKKKQGWRRRETWYVDYRGLTEERTIKAVGPSRGSTRLFGEG